MSTPQSWRQFYWGCAGPVGAHVIFGYFDRESTELVLKTRVARRTPEAPLDCQLRISHGINVLWLKVRNRIWSLHAARLAMLFLERLQLKTLQSNGYSIQMTRPKRVPMSLALRTFQDEKININGGEQLHWYSLHATMLTLTEFFWKMVERE